MDKKKAIFLDKDGTIVDSSMYPEIPRSKLLTEEVIDGLLHLQNKGYDLFIVSNQSWVAKDKLSINEANLIFCDVTKKLSGHGIKIKDYTFCPHKTEDYCDCRKPRPGMILSLAKKHNIDLNNSFLIGDFDEDIEAGKNAGVKTILTLTNHQTHYKNSPNFIIRNINEVKNIL